MGYHFSIGGLPSIVTNQRSDDPEVTRADPNDVAHCALFFLSLSLSQSLPVPSLPVMKSPPSIEGKRKKLRNFPHEPEKLSSSFHCCSGYKSQMSRVPAVGATGR